MLMVYGLDNSPDAATTAMNLAAHWASLRREVLLIEADPAGGTLSDNLGMPFTPGSASFVASGLPPLSNHLIDHAQDVLYESLHIMPAPASPSGASSIAEIISEHAAALKGISEHEMAVIIEGGRVSASTVNAKLASACTALLAVARRDSQMSSVEHLKRIIGGTVGRSGPKGCAVSIGPSPWTEEEWQQAGLTYFGAIEPAPHPAGDLSPFLNKGKSKRKARSWRSSLDAVAAPLYSLAQPPPASKPDTEQPSEQAAVPDAEPPEPDSPVAPSPGSTPEQPPAHAPAAHEQPPAHAPAAHEQPPAHAPAPVAYPPIPGPDQPPPAAYPPPAYYEQAPQPAAFAPPPPAMQGPHREAIPPTGSFRDWATKLKGGDEHGDEHGDRSTGRGTA